MNRLKSKKGMSHQTISYNNIVGYKLCSVKSVIKLSSGLIYLAPGQVEIML